MNTKAIHVLLVDDDEDDRTFFKEALEVLEYSTDIEYAENGAEAIERLNKDGVKLPDIVFLDFNMPLMSGKDCLQHIRSRDRYSHIPIVIYSTSYNPANANILRGLGADRYIRKPATFEGLKRVVSTALREFGRKRDFSVSDGDFVIQAH